MKKISSLLAFSISFIVTAQFSFSHETLNSKKPLEASFNVQNENLRHTSLSNTLEHSKINPWRYHKESWSLDLSSQNLKKEGFIIIERNDTGAFRSENKFFIYDSSQQNTLSEYHRNTLSGSVECDGQAFLETDSKVQKIEAMKEVEFLLYKTIKNLIYGFNLNLITNPHTKTCRIFFKSRVDQKNYKIELRASSKNSWESITYRCPFFEAKTETPLRQFFLTKDYQSYTCPISSNSIKPLADEKEAFQIKVRSLLGKNLPQKFFELGDPYLPLDFSEAPDLEAVFLSYLTFRSDFYGAIIRRLLEYHAKKGVQIKIMVSEVITPSKATKALESFSEKYTNVSVVFYKYHSYKSLSVKDKFDGIHRVLHIKMFIVWPKNKEIQKPLVIIGGRNIHDGFLFLNPPDLTKYPDLAHYNKEGGIPFWTDMEVSVTDEDIVKVLTTHFFSFWNYSRASYKMTPIASYFKTDIPLAENFFSEDKTYVRHLISSPYSDGKSLEKFFEKLILSAEKSIKIVSPYFNLTETLAYAFEKASEKGLEIEFITRLELEHDTIDIILSDVNKKAINKFFDVMKFYEYTMPGDILHSKMILLDEEVVVVGAVNLNKRSFLHDLENTFVVWSPSFYKEMEDVFEDYKKASRPITEKLKSALWKRFLIYIFDDVF